jgi:hypothetical protein
LSPLGTLVQSQPFSYINQLCVPLSSSMIISTADTTNKAMDVLLLHR